MKRFVENDYKSVVQEVRLNRLADRKALRVLVQQWAAAALADSSAFWNRKHNGHEQLAKAR